MRALQMAHDQYLAAFRAGNGRTMAELAGGEWSPPYLSIVFLGRCLAISQADGTITPPLDDMRERALLYKYLTEAQGMAGPADEYIALSELPHGTHHQASFRNDALVPLAQRFGADFAALTRAAAAYGGVKGDGGDVSYRFTILPKISLQVILWGGDEEFSARATVLFDRRCHFHLDTDGLGNLAEVLTNRLLKEADQ